MKPTVIGDGNPTAVADRVTPLGFTPTTIGVAATTIARPNPAGTGIVLKPEQAQAVGRALQQLDFATMRPQEIVQLGQEAEQALQQALDGFLKNLDQESAAQVFALFDRLQKGVDDAKLPKVLKAVQSSDQPGFWVKVGGLIRRKSSAQIAQQVMDQARSLVSQRTKNLADAMGGLEQDLARAIGKLVGELDGLGELKYAYGEHFGNFAVAVAVSQQFLAQARQHVEREAADVQQGDLQGQQRITELKAKLQLLESRALALEGTYTRLPSDAAVIAQIEGAGVATLQETVTTSASRFASIKMTLLALHGAFAVKGVQALGQRQAALDRQLLAVRGSLMNDIVSTAATAPGDNRLAQADQITTIVKQNQELKGLVAKARTENEKKFAEAREKFAEARRQLATA